MKNNKLRKSFIIVILAFILLSFNKISFAEPKENFLGNNIYSKSEIINSDIIFKGVFSNYSFYFNVDKWINVESLTSNININVNQLVDSSKESYITFSLNGVPFYSKDIIYDESKKTQNIKVDIPLDNIKEGANEFKIEGYCRISDEPCVDDVNIANWIVIKKDSSVDIKYKERVVDNKIMNFPYPFIKASNNNDTKIVIPNDYSDYDLQRAFLLSSYLVGNNTINNKIEIIKYNDLKKKDNDSNIIYLGSKDSIPSEINNMFSDLEGLDLSSSAVIRLGNSPYTNDKDISKLMVITSEDESYNLKAINLLRNDDLISQIDSDKFIVTKDINEIMKVDEVKNIVSLKDMGINELQFKGLFRSESTISYFIPKNRVISDGGKIKLNFRYSDNLDFDKSLLTVYINNSPIGSKKLEKENALNDNLEITIPSNAIANNYVEIKLAFDLELPNTYCERREEEMPWAVISGDSYINYATENSMGYFFDKYPAPFVVDNRFNDVLLSVPDTMSSEELTLLGDIFEIIGTEISNNTGNLEVARYSNLNEREKDKNLIIYGTPKNNELIKDVNNNLWFKYDENYDKFIGNEKLFLTEDFNSNISIFQLDISPYNKQRAMLVLTSPNKDILIKSLRYLGDNNKLINLSGDSVIVDKYGEIRTFKFKEDIKTPIYEKFIKLESNSKLIIGLLVLIAIFIGLSVFMFYSKNKKDKL
ncbi:cellulose biosynthesis cyclic di-GMP-binding regulatory protein BcsB [Clostridium sp. Sa3CUN1]|uniref:Cellulose biosynthesis cyclic di-GMP-binding regulatory protein BcsB n=1 Tax=Clostridium gallinarum TaxID=2762246 RepID=A0ABR8Q6P0_9CLOT|nr:cellulose biosynthesis cyclic di-GMP-binding regulatory protein BcsB [Clostridium gallinarum]MBD7916098.1 cellulose biosynthesis cyclic di-GMP-binding regulatory protein BcsB [Clostridium gallinarum]